jgi:hypothetical protein
MTGNHLPKHESSVYTSTYTAYRHSSFLLTCYILNTEIGIYLFPYLLSILVCYLFHESVLHLVENNCFFIVHSIQVFILMLPYI